MKIIKEKNKYFFLNDTMQVLISQEIMAKYHLLIKEYPEDTLFKIYEENLFAIGYEKALKYLKNVRCKFDIYLYLKDLNITDEINKAVIDKLEDLKLVNDLSYAKLYANIKSSKYGKLYIKERLLEKRIKKEYIEIALSEISETESLEKRIHYYFILEKGSIKNKEKIIKQKLYQKGYNIDLVEDAYYKYIKQKNIKDIDLIKEDIKKISSKLSKIKDEVSKKENLKIKLLKLGYDYFLISDFI